MAKASAPVKSPTILTSLANTAKKFCDGTQQARFASKVPIYGNTAVLPSVKQGLTNLGKYGLPTGAGICAIRAAKETQGFIEQSQRQRENEAYLRQVDALSNKRSAATSDVPSSSSQFGRSIFEAHVPRPSIFVTPPATRLPNLPGLVPPTLVTGTRTEFPGEIVGAPPPSIFVPSEELPASEGFPDASSEFNRPAALLFSKKKDHTADSRPHEPSSGHIPVPKTFKGPTGTLPAFPGSTYGGRTNDKRDKWILKDKTFATWDKRHGAVDLFNKTGKIHLGKYDPYTGKKLKDPKPERSSKP